MRCWRAATGECAGGAEAGDECGIDAIGFVAVSEAAGVVFDAARVGDVDGAACGVHLGGGQFAVMAGGFEDGERRGGSVLFAPSAEAGDAGFGVVKLRVIGAWAQEQAGIELGFGDVEAQTDVDGFVEDHGCVCCCGCDVVVFAAGRLEASPVERGLVCGLPPAMLTVLDTIRLFAGEAAGTGAVLMFGLVVPSRCRFTRPAASNWPVALYYTVKRQAGRRQPPDHTVKNQSPGRSGGNIAVRIRRPIRGGFVFGCRSGGFARSSLHCGLISGSPSGTLRASWFSARCEMIGNANNQSFPPPFSEVQYGRWRLIIREQRPR